MGEAIRVGRLNVVIDNNHTVGKTGNSRQNHEDKRRSDDNERRRITNTSLSRACESEFVARCKMGIIHASFPCFC